MGVHRNTIEAVLYTQRIGGGGELSRQNAVGIDAEGIRFVKLGGKVLYILRVEAALYSNFWVNAAPCW